MQKQKIDPDRFIFLKDVSMDELPSIYQLADIFVYPSIFEGFGIPIIEALYSGTPVITTKGGCFPEAAGPDSMFVDSENYEEVANAIDSLLEDPEKRRSMSEAGKAYVQRFEPQLLSEQVLGIYEELLSPAEV